MVVVVVAAAAVEAAAAAAALGRTRQHQAAPWNPGVTDSRVRVGRGGSKRRHFPHQSAEHSCLPACLPVCLRLSPDRPQHQASQPANQPAQPTRQTDVSRSAHRCITARGEWKKTGRERPSHAPSLTKPQTEQLMGSGSMGRGSMGGGWMARWRMDRSINRMARAHAHRPNSNSTTSSRRRLCSQRSSMIRSCSTSRGSIVPLAHRVSIPINVSQTSSVSPSLTRSHIASPCGANASVSWCCVRMLQSSSRTAATISRAFSRLSHRCVINSSCIASPHHEMVDDPWNRRPSRPRSLLKEAFVVVVVVCVTTVADHASCPLFSSFACDKCVRLA